MKQRALGCVVLALSMSTQAQAPLESSIQATLVLRVLTFDRDFCARAPAKAKIALVHAPGDAAGCNGLDVQLEKLRKAGRRIAGKELLAEAVPFTGRAPFTSDLKARGPSAIFVCAGLPQSSLPDLRATARELRLFTMTGTEAYGAQGASLLLGTGDGKVKLLLDAAAAKAEGADLEAGLLNLTQSRQGERR